MENINLKEIESNELLQIEKIIKEYLAYLEKQKQEILKDEE